MPKLDVSAIKSTECALCKYVVTYLDAVLQNNKSEAAIDAALEKVCGILPATIKANCIKFVDTYGPILAQLLVKYTTPDQVCNALKVCTNGTDLLQPVMSNIFGLSKLTSSSFTSISESVDALRKIQKRSVSPLKKTVSAVKGVECLLCKYVVSYVDAVVKNNKSEAAIESALEKVCDVLPASFKDKCKELVVTYGPILPAFIARYGSPDQVCDALKLCNNGTQSAIRELDFTVPFCCK